MSSSKKIKDKELNKVNGGKILELKDNKIHIQTPQEKAMQELEEQAKKSAEPNKTPLDKVYEEMMKQIQESSNKLINDQKPKERTPQK